MKFYRCNSLVLTYPPEGYDLFFAFWRKKCASINVFSNRVTLKRAKWKLSTFCQEFKEVFGWTDVRESNALEILVVAHISMDYIKKFLTGEAGSDI